MSHSNLQKFSHLILATLLLLIVNHASALTAIEVDLLYADDGVWSDLFGGSIAYYHAMHQVGVGPKVTGVEQVRPAYYLIKGERASGEPYRRRVDIVLAESDGSEEWVEVKSLSKSTFSKSNFYNNPFKKKSYYRQFFHDMRLNTHFMTGVPKYVGKILPPDEGGKQNKRYTWWFQQWKNETKGIPPGSAQENKAREWLCYKPNINNITNYYKYNMALSPGATKTACGSIGKGRIKLRDSESYVTEVIARLIRDKGLDAQDYLDFINSITDPAWQ